MGSMIEKAIDQLYQKIILSLFEPVKDLFGVFTATQETLRVFTFIDLIYSKLRIVAIALIVLITCYQVFKNFFAYLGFECEEPWRIAFRAIAFGFLTWYSKDIVYIGLDIFNRALSQLWTAYGISGNNQFTDIIKSFVMTALVPPVGVSLFTWQAIMFIYLAYKFIKLAFRFAERFMFTVLLIMSSPLAFACGASQVTKGFLQGWTKLFVGNLLVQLLQVAIFISMVIYRANDANLLNLMSFVIIIAMIKVLEKLEDIVRDASVSVGIGRDFSSGIQKIQNTVYSVTQGVQVANAVRSVIGK